MSHTAITRMPFDRRCYTFLGKQKGSVEGFPQEAVKVMEKVYYPSGQLEYIGRFENGVEHGEWVYYYENGVKKYLETWEKGVEHGIHYDYSPDGQVYRELHYEHGRLVKEVDRSKPH